MWLAQIKDRPDLVEPVARGMREWDQREIYATRWNEDPVELAAEAVLMGQEVGWVAGDDQGPIAAFGCYEMWPGCWSMWLFATDRFHQIGLAVTRLVKRQIVPMLWSFGARRLEARSMEGHSDAQRWLGTIGARREGTLAAYGRDGDDFHVYVWEKP